MTKHLGGSMGDEHKFNNNMLMIHSRMDDINRWISTADLDCHISDERKDELLAAIEHLAKLVKRL